jgi:hypothetical protein
LCYFKYKEQEEEKERERERAKNGNRQTHKQVDYFCTGFKLNEKDCSI